MKSTFTTKIVLLTFSLLIVGGTTWQLVRAQTEAPFGGNEGDWNYSSTEQGLTETGSSDPNDYNFNDYTQGGGLTEGNQQGELEKSRQKASEQCQAESNGLGGIVQKAGSLAQTISQSLSQTFNKTVSNLLGQKIPSIIQNQLSTKLPNLIQSNLRSRMPGMVNSRIGQMQRAGMSDSAIKQALPQLLNQIIQQITVQTVQQQTPLVIEQGLKEELPPELVQQFNDQIPGIIENSNFANQVGEMVGETTAEIPATVSTGEGTTLLTRPTGVEVIRGKELTITQGLIDGSIEAAQNGINNSGAVIGISDQLSSLLTSKIAPVLMQSLMPQINNMFAGGAGGSGSISGMFDSSLSFAGLDITGANFDLSQGLAGDFFNPVADAIRVPLADTVQFNIASLQGADGLQFFGDTNANFAQAISFSDSDLVGGGFGSDGAGGFTSLGTDSAGAIGSASDSIVQGGLGGIDWGGIGTNMQLGLVNGLAGGLSGLAGNIPFVGGLVAPIVDQVVQQALIQMFGIPVMSPAWPVSDFGVVQTVANNTKGVTKAVGEVNKTANKIQGDTSKIDKSTKDIKSLAQQSCTLEKQMNNELKNLNQKFFKYDPDARMASLLGTRQLADSVAKYQASSFKTSPGESGVANNANNQNGEGQPAVAQLDQNISGAQREVVNRVVTQTNDSDNIHSNEVAQAYQQISSRNYVEQIKSTMTKEEFGFLSDPTKLKDMPSEQFWDLLLKSLEPQNNADGTFMEVDRKVSADKQNAKDLAIAQYIAGQGWNDTRECSFWNDSPAPGDTSGGTANGLGGLKWCWDWVILTPGSTNKALREKTSLAEIDYAIGTQYLQGDAVSQYLADPLRRAANMSEAPAQYETQTGSDPCPGTDPCPNTGWKSNQVPTLNDAFINGLNAGASNVSDTLGNWFDSTINSYTNSSFNFGNYGGYTSGNGSSGSGLGQFSDLGSILNDVQWPDPELNYFRLANNGSNLEWSANNSLACMAGNNWEGTEYLAYKALPGIEGQITLDLPPIHGQFSYNIRCLGFGPNTATTETLIVPANNQ